MNLFSSFQQVLYNIFRSWNTRNMCRILDIKWVESRQQFANISFLLNTLVSKTNFKTGPHINIKENTFIKAVLGLEGRCVCGDENKTMTTKYTFFSYDPSTGAFTVPPGGDGLYYFSIYLSVDDGEHGWFNIRVNGGILWTAEGDLNADGTYDNPQATSSGLAQLTQGNH